MWENIMKDIEEAKKEPWYRLNNYAEKSKIDRTIDRVLEIVRKNIND